ncbi:MAG: hypothetical protein ACRC8S_10085 [Fimbriiglobus sp.]
MLTTWLFSIVTLFTLTGLLLQPPAPKPPTPPPPAKDIFTAEDDRFTLAGFGKPSTNEKKSIQYGLREEQVVETTLTKWSLPQHKNAYGAISLTLYPESFQSIPTKKILDGVRDGLRGPKSLGGNIESEKEITIGPDKVPAREVVISANKNWVRAQILFHNGYLYQVLITGSKDQVKSEVADKFLQGFTPGSR